VHVSGQTLRCLPPRYLVPIMDFRDVT
jgi:hypothetical protein